MNVFWDVARCSLVKLTDVSEVLTASISRAMMFQGLTAPSMKMAVLWDVTPRSLVEIDRRFRGAYCLYHKEMSHHNSVVGGSKNL
jgi:hypothetical protein